MAISGFRHPRFSEDLAWVPTWLQQHQGEASEQSETTTSQAFENLAILQGNISEGKDVDLLSREEGGYNSCHLFLSGEDNSSTSFAPSSGNALHFRLHLSSSGDSQYTKSELLYASQALCGSDKLLSMQQVKTSAGAGQNTDIFFSLQQAENLASAGNKTVNKLLPVQQAETSAGNGDKLCKLKMDKNAVGVNLLPLTSFPKTVENLGVQSPINDQDSGGHGEKLKGTDINDAVELSISASEALVIHELAKSESGSEALPTTAVLEAALRMKQARLEGLEDAFLYSSEEIDEIDFLSDLDDSTMVDAYDDVGLSFIGLNDKQTCGSDAFRVKSTPLSENYDGCDNGIKHVDFLPRQKKPPVESGLELNSSRLASQVDPILHQSAQEISHVLDVAQHEDGMNSFHAWNSDDAAGNDGKSYLVADRFRSRWFGGWTAKEVDAPTGLEHNNSKRVPKFYVKETSFLTESADIAPNENSVQKHDIGSKIASQSSVHFEGFCNKDDEGVLFSQDVSSSCLSLVDPLCSVVPCSISSANTNSFLTQKHNVDGEKCLVEDENLRRISDLKVESVYGDRQEVPTASGEDSQAPVRRKLTSLKTYSTLLPKHDANLEKKRLYHNQSLLSECDAEPINVEQNLGCSKSPDKRYSDGFLSFRSASECTIGRNDGEAYNTIVIRRSSEEATNNEKGNDKHAKDGVELQLQPLKESRSPLILNRRTRCHPRTSKLFTHSSMGKKKPEETIVEKTQVELHQKSSFQNIQFASIELRDTQVPARKRVHFSEVEVELRQNQDIQKLQSSHKILSSTRATKRSKYNNRSLDSRTQDVKRCSTTRIRGGKRLIFQGIEFLLTGLPSHTAKEIEGLIRKNGGIARSDIPPPNSRGKRSSKSNSQQLPIVLCPRKLKTTQFLYGCSVNALILKVKWLTDSIAAGSVLPVKKYMILSNQADAKITVIGKPVCYHGYKPIFDRVGIMFHGKHSFCNQFAIICKHGGGLVFKTLQWLVQSLETEKITVGCIVAEDERRASRHLRHCALERKIPMLPASWIIKSLHLGKLLPFTQNKHTHLPTVSVPEFPISLQWSEEI